MKVLERLPWKAEPLLSDPFKTNNRTSYVSVYVMSLSGGESSCFICLLC